MKVQWPDSAQWQALGRAVNPGVDLAAGLLALPSAVRVTPGAPGTGAIRTGEATVSLGEDLLGPGLMVGEDDHLASRAPPGVALDRFRRSTGALLEAVLLPGARCGPWEHAAAADAVDAALPALGWLAPSAWGLAHHPGVSLLASPRRGAWWRRYAAPRGLPLDDPSPEDWACFGLWCRDPRVGPAASVAMDLGASPPQPWGHPLPLGPLAHAVRQLPSGRGAAVVQGVPAVPRGHIDGGVVVVGLVSTAANAWLTPAGPVGRWALSSGHFGAQVGAARGVELTLFASGRAELVGADAFVGPATAPVLALAEQFGVSGVSQGRWRVASLGAQPGCGTVRIEGFRATDGTVHPRSGHGFALPAAEWLRPVQGFLDLLAGQAVRYQIRGAHLLVEADVNGMPLQLRLERVTDQARGSRAR